MFKGKIIATVGASASGKSTWAHEEWQKDPLNTIVIERDNIRNLLFGYGDDTIKNYYKRDDFGKLEKEVTKFQNTLIYDALEQGKTVILSNTNLDRKRDLESLKYWNVPVELREFEVPLEELIIRDSKRVRTVGETIIKKQYNKQKQLIKSLIDNPIDFTPVTDINTDRTLPDCIVFDIDGCLADNQGLRNPFDWSKVEEDIPIKSVVDTFNIYSGIKPLFICSGRDEVCREGTTRWLTDYLDLVGDVKLLMRDQGDFRPDWVVKQEMAREINKTHYISAWYDDRMQVTRHLRSLGIKVFNVEHNNF